MVSEAGSSEASPKSSPAGEQSSPRTAASGATASASKQSPSRAAGTGFRSAVALIACMAVHMSQVSVSVAAPLLPVPGAAAGLHVTVLAATNTAVLQGIERQKVGR